MTTTEILTLIRDCAFIGAFCCYIVYYVALTRQIRKRNKMYEERERDLRALCNLQGEEYMKALSEYKKKYL